MGNLIKDIQKTVKFWLMILDKVWSRLWVDMRTLTLTLGSFALLAWIATCLFFNNVIPAVSVDPTWSQLWLGLATACSFTLILFSVAICSILFIPADVYEKQLDNLRKYEDEKNAARAEKIRIREVKRDSNWVGIELFNGENKKFMAHLQVIDIAELDHLSNPLNLTNPGESIAESIVYTGSWSTYSLAEWLGGDKARFIFEDTKFIYINPGEYTILTALNGVFGGWNAGFRIDPVQTQWRLIFKPEDRIFELRKAKD